MEIYSLSFFLLVSVGLILYYTVFSRCQWICLLGLSLLFFTASGWKGLVFLLFTALTIWLGGLQLAKLDADSAARRKTPGITKDEKKAIKAQAVRRKKCLVAAVLTANFLVLGYFQILVLFCGAALRCIFGHSAVLTGAGHAAWHQLLHVSGRRLSD